MIRRLIRAFTLLANELVPRNTVPVLYYHSLDDHRTPMSTSPKLFRAQMEYLYNQGYKVVSLRELYYYVVSGSNLSRIVGLAFDDGFSNFYDIALPLLRRFKFRATVFVIPLFVGQHTNWPYYKEQLQMLSWDQIRVMLESDIEVGAHGLTHRALAGLDVDSLYLEVQYSKLILDTMLNINTFSFCYPNGLYDNKTLNMVIESGYKMACTTKEGHMHRSRNLYELRRLHIEDGVTLVDFKSFLTAYFDSYVLFKQYVVNYFGKLAKLKSH